MVQRVKCYREYRDQSNGAEGQVVQGGQGSRVQRVKGCRDQVMQDLKG